jgi:hypothetical protein
MYLDGMYTFSSITGQIEYFVDYPTLPCSEACFLYTILYDWNKLNFESNGCKCRPTFNSRNIKKTMVQAFRS